MVIPWENHGKTVGKWENHGKMVIDMENGKWSIEIDGLPNFNMVIFHGAMLNNQRVNIGSNTDF
jgi:hypothetical protein